MASYKSATVVSAILEKLQLIIGMLMTTIFGLTAIISIEKKKTSTGTIFALIILAIIGVLLIILSRKRKALIENYKIYEPIICVDPTGSIENLALGLGVSQDVVKKNLEKMIKKGYFSNMYIDAQNNRVAFNTASENYQSNAVKIEYIAITCKSCGGINKVANGTTVE